MRFDLIVCSLTVVLQRSHVGGVPPLLYLCPPDDAPRSRGVQSSRMMRYKFWSSGFFNVVLDPWSTTLSHQNTTSLYLTLCPACLPHAHVHHG